MMPDSLARAQARFSSRSRLAATLSFTLTIASACEGQSTRAETSTRVDSIPFELEDTRIYVPVRDSSQSLGWFILDTGAQPSGAKATILFAEPFLRRAGVDSALTGASFIAPLGAGVGGRTRYRRFTRVPEVTLGRNDAGRWSNLVVGLSVGGTISSSYFDGLFGLDMLLRYTPTFDYKRSRLILVPRAQPPASSEIDLSGVFLVEERTPRTVRASAIVESSPASAANIAVGDELVEIDGRAATAVMEKVVVLRRMA